MLTQVKEKLEKIDKELIEVIESPPYSDNSIPQFRMARLLAASECLRKELTSIVKDVSVKTQDEE